MNGLLAPIKQQFYAFRNGVVADVLRKAGDSHRVIFGLNLPQLAEVAATVGKDRAVADALWADADCRESRLLAPMVCPPESVDGVRIMELVDSACTVEEIDILCHRLLRKVDNASGLAGTLWTTGRKYAALRLMLNLLPDVPALARECAASVTEADGHAAMAAARQIIDELEFV